MPGLQRTGARRRGCLLSLSRSFDTSRRESIARSSRYAYELGARLGKAFRRA